MKTKKVIVFSLLVMLLASTMACGGGGEPAATPTPALTPTPTPTLTPSPTPGLTPTTTPTPLEPEWSRTFGGPERDGGLSVQQTSDGGFIVAGYTESFGAGEQDVYLIKTDASGNEQWSRTFGGPENDWGWSVQQTSDGGFIVAGGTDSFGAGGWDVCLIKTDASGNEQWSNTFGGPDNGGGVSVQQTSAGGFVIAGTTYGLGDSDVYLIKTDASGNDQWSRTFGGPEDDWANSMQQTSDGGFIVAGWTDSFGAGGRDVYLIKTDASGNEEWSRTFGGPEDDWANSMQQTSDGGFMVAGGTRSFGADGWDVYLIRTDASGNEQWSSTFGGPENDWGWSVQQTSDGGFIVAGGTDSFGAGVEDVYLIKTDTSGNEQWSSTFGGPERDEGWSVQQTSDGGFIIVGSTGSFGAGDVYLIKVAPEK